MFKNLNSGAIGIRNLSLPETLALAQKTGFQGIDFNIREAADLAEEHSVDYVHNLFSQANIQPGCWGLPVAWRDEDRWQSDLADLPALAALGRQLGASRTTTWCPPSSAEREFDDNFTWHVNRFGAIAQVLKEEGCRFGLEFIGPKTMRPADQHDFIYTQAGMLELCDAIGTGNVGLLLDAYHLYTAGGSVADLDSLSNENVVVVHVNDAPAGLAREEQLDQVRCLPMETGVIDLPGFMQKLAAIGYNGPVTAEPFSQSLNNIENPTEAAQRTADSLTKMWQAAGLEGRD